MSGPTAGLAAPGTSSYNSDTMSVGDGTWDSTTNTFLLPNLQGLNFATMQYNGMGNRFSSLEEYHGLIRAHGTIGAIVFLLIVPFAIMFNRFYGREPWFALKIHIWCQILTLLLTTVVFILGNIAVGPSRALTNPHHDIGLAIYVLVLFQFFSGWLTHRGEKKRRKAYAPVKAVLHMWFGRLTALLGLAQVPLGLTLYGSPSYLFVLYSLVTAALILIYFVLSYVQEKNRGRDYESQLSYEEETRKSGRWGKYAAAAAAGIGVSALANRLRHRRDVASRHSGSVSSISEEKYSQYGHRHDDDNRAFTKKNILGLGTLAALSYWIGGKLGKRHNKKDRDDLTNSTFTEDSLAEAEQGRHGASPGPSPAPHHALNPRAHRRNESEISGTSYFSDDDDGPPSRHGGGHGFRNAAIGIGTFAAAKNFFQKRKQKKEDQRIEELRQQELEDERLQRANSKKYTGDGIPRPNAPSMTSTNLTPAVGPTAAGALGTVPMGQPQANYSQTAYPPQAYPPHGYPPQGYPPQGYLPQGQPSQGYPPQGYAPQGYPSQIYPSNGQPQSVRPVNNASIEDPFVNPVMAPPPPPHSAGMSTQSWESRGNQQHVGNGANMAAGAAGLVAGAAAGYAAGGAMNNRNQSSSKRRESGGTGGTASADNTVTTPPVSVKLNMHNDGRHVTLRRLTEEEAAAERARHERNRARRRRAGSTSSLSANDAGYPTDRYRRRSSTHQRQQEALARNNPTGMGGVQYAPTASGVPMPIPPPPPIPQTEPRPTPPQGQSSVGSPGTFDDSMTGGSTIYDDNRRRRRAERAAASREKAARANARPEFS